MIMMIGVWGNDKCRVQFTSVLLEQLVQIWFIGRRLDACLLQFVTKKLVGLPRRFTDNADFGSILLFGDAGGVVACHATGTDHHHLYAPIGRSAHVVAHRIPSF